MSVGTYLIPGLELFRRLSFVLLQTLDLLILSSKTVIEPFVLLSRLSDGILQLADVLSKLDEKVCASTS